MSRFVILVLRVVIAVALAGSLFVQGVIIPLLWQDLEGARPVIRVSLVVIFVLGIVTMQVTAICIWRLLTMVRRGTVFSYAAFRYVDVIIGAISTASILSNTPAKLTSCCRWIAMPWIWPPVCSRKSASPIATIVT